ncbi:MAG TPA: type II CAAX endopeptidase family protein [Ktedonobacteraceae bacterium]|nr:type II CAAX endopeptidase family protein [Ktedonobacteraceae bacterium]
MIEQQPDSPKGQVTANAHAARLKLNWVPWTVQMTFRGVLFTLIPWIGFNLLLNATGGNTGPSKPLSFGDDLGGAIVGIAFAVLVEGAFLIAPYYYANKTLVPESLREGEARVRAIFRSLGLRRFNFWRTLPWIIGLIVVIIGVNWLYDLAITALHLNLQSNSQVVQQYSVYEPLTTYAVLAGSVFIAPFCEEIFFRGFTFSGLLRDLSPFWAVLISSALFAIAHADPGSFVPLFAIGLCLGFLRWRTGSTWASMSLHILNNLLASVDIILAMHHINLPF